MSFVRMCMIIVMMLPIVGCGMNDEKALDMAESSRTNDNNSQCFGANDCLPGQICNEFGFCAVSPAGAAPTTDGGVPPEVENKAEPPASGKTFVYIAVPEQDRVAKIDSQTLAVKALKVGKSPGALRTIPGEDVAVVLNRNSATAMILRSDDQGEDQIITLPTAPSLNALTLAPDGKYGVAYFDITLTNGSLPPNPSLQEVTLLHLSSGQELAIDLPVGFRPLDVQFSADSRRAFVITEDGVSIIDLAKTQQSMLVPTIPLLKDPLQEPTPAEVLITPDGTRALVRQPGAKILRVVDLVSGTIQDIAMESEPSDIDLNHDGSVAVVVLRDAHKVLLFDLPGDLMDPGGADELSTGSYVAGQAVLTEDGTRAFLFSNAVDQEVLMVANLIMRTISTHPLKKGVRTVFPAPDGATALIIHNKIPGDSLPEDGVELLLDKSHGFSIFSVAAGYTKLEITEAEPRTVAFKPDSSSAYLMLAPTETVKRVAAINLESFLVDSLALGSPPISLGLVAATNRVYVAQNHELGRVTFIDMDSLEPRTVTGFELNSYIIE